MLVFYMALTEEKEFQTQFEALYYAYRKQMLIVAQRVLGSRTEAEDAVQLALLNLSRHMESLPEEEPFRRAYVLTTAKNAAISLLRKRKEELSLEEEALPLKDPAPSLFEQVQRSLDYELLLRSLGRLKPKYREVLLLICVRGLSIQETAELLCRKPGTVRQQLSRGKQLAVKYCREEGLSFEE